MSRSKLTSKVNKQNIKDFIKVINLNGNSPSIVTMKDVLEALQKHILTDFYLVDIKGAPNKLTQFTKDNQNIYDLMKITTERYMIQLCFFCKLIFSQGSVTIEDNRNVESINNIVSLIDFIQNTIVFTTSLTINSKFNKSSPIQFKNNETKTTQVTMNSTQKLVQMLLSEFSANNNKGIVNNNNSQKIITEYNNYRIIMGGLVDTLSTLYEMFKPSLSSTTVFIPDKVTLTNRQNIAITNVPGYAGASKSISSLYTRILAGINALVKHKIPTTTS
jgi:hypothetical protein